MEKTSGRNLVIRFFPKYLAIGQKSSKTVIDLDGKPISAYPFPTLARSHLWARYHLKSDF